MSGIGTSVDARFQENGIANGIVRYRVDRTCLNSGGSLSSPDRKYEHLTPGEALVLFHS
jgi:hypothetical protein